MTTCTARAATATCSAAAARTRPASRPIHSPASAPARRTSQLQFSQAAVRDAGRRHSIRGHAMGIFSKEIQSMNDLFLHTLRDVYYAEKQILKALPQMVEKAT